MDPTGDAPETGRLWPGWLGALLGRGAKWLAVLVIVSVMVPALTTQWSDRQKELDLKTSLVTQMTSSAAVATQDAFTLVADEAKSKPVKDTQWRTDYRNILKEWRVSAFTLESELDAYFPKVTLAIDRQRRLVLAYDDYNTVVQDYIRLSLDECSGNKGRRGAIDSVYGYLGAKAPTVIKTNPPGSGNGVPCWKKSEAFRLAYQDLGGALLARRDVLVDAVIHSNAAGYNVGFKDFLHQVLPFI